MLQKNESRIIQLLVANIGADLTFSDIAAKLGQKYPQTHRSIKNLLRLGLIKEKKIGKSNIAKLDYSKHHPEYAIAEIERLLQINNKDIFAVVEKVIRVNKQFICILFGSYSTGRYTKASDVDLLFIIPDEYGLDRFTKIVRSYLAANNADINVIDENSLFEMWASPQKLNVGNEILKSHIVLAGAEYFINLVRKHYVGR